MAVSRRSFVKGSAAGIAAGALVAGSAASVMAGEQAAPVAAPMAEEADYLNIYADGVNLMPGRKATCPGPQGPIAFEAREIAESEIVREEEFDLVVVGAGIGGLTATLKAADMGAKVLLLEKMTKGRGCFECFGAVGAKCQEGTEIDKTVLLDEILRSAYYRTRPEPAQTYVNRSGEATDFWQAMLDKGNNGFIITKVEQAPSSCGFPAMTPIIDSELGFYDSPCLPVSAGWRSGLSGIYVCLEMQDVAKTAYDTIDMRFSTPAVQLTTDESGAVTGVIAKDAEGYFRVKAAKGVILATGGYDCNPRLMEAWTRPEDYVTSSWWNPGWGTTGDGHMMALAIGAGMDPVPQPVMNFRWGTPDSFCDYRTWNAVYFGILVNGRGKRFVREDLPFQCVSNAQNAQPAFGKNCWYIFDEGMYDGMQDAVEEFESKGWLYEADTPQELAEKCGIDGEGLAATLEAYAAAFEKGVDEELGRDLMVTMPFTGGKLFAFTSNSNILATVGGLTIDGNCSVLDQNDCPIPGLFACGNASGNFFAGNYARHIPGTSIGRAVTFGYVAAESALNGTIDPDPIVEGAAPALASYDPALADPEMAINEESLGWWNPADPMHGGSTANTPQQIAVAVQSCDNCHVYRPGGETVADNMKFGA
ncbi:MAG: FAD-binding protein [Coriobacteriales bacterium]|nr:FAD-binding protein [Coriobacteriales bacterium]